jgi:hypothetical protein
LKYKAAYDRIKSGGKYMEENKRLYPISEEVFNQKILPIIKDHYIWKGRPPKVSHYKAFCGILISEDRLVPGGIYLKNTAIGM